MKKFLITISIFAVCTIVLAEDGKVTPQEKEKPDTRSVIVDAWLVKVDAEALYKSGVKPLSEKDKENVSIMNLLWCLGDPNNGTVMVSAKTYSSMNEEAYCELSKTGYLKQERGSVDTQTGKTVQRSISFTPYSSKTRFSNMSRMMDNKKIRIEYALDSEVTLICQEDSNSPQNNIKIDFRNILILPVQKPVIVAQSQIGNDMLFLVLRAELVD
jgi:hypothetical protein